MDRKVFYIDVDDMPEEVAREYVRRIMEEFKRKKK